MTDDGEFYPLGMSCVHCGGALSARRTSNPSSFSIKGLIPLEYRHTATGSEKCTVTYKARPYDGWTASKAYEAMRAESTDAE